MVARWGHGGAGLLVGLAALLAGCGGMDSPDSPAAPDGAIADGGRADAFSISSLDTSAASDGAPSPDGPNPFELPVAVSSGGPVLSAPRVQPIYLSGFPYPAEMDRLLANLAASAYWKQVTSEYGVGALTVLPSDHSDIDVPSAITDAEVPGLIQSALMEHASALGPPRADTIYALFLPPSTSLSIRGTSFCGTGAPSAFHQELDVSGVAVPAVVIPTCGMFGASTTLMGADALSPSLAHELVEAATDPLPDTAPAFDTTDPQHLVWTVAVSGGEVADLCENEVPNLIRPPDVGFPVPRVWSNAAAGGLGGPCVPVPEGDPYFTAVAHLPDMVQVRDLQGAVVDLPALVAPVGANASVEVDLRAGTGAPSSWQVLAIEYHGAASMSGATATMPSAVVGRAGETRTIPVLAPAKATAGTFPLVILSHSSRGAVHLWVGAIDRR
jgi:hypothetical protein